MEPSGLFSKLDLLEQPLMVKMSAYRKPSVTRFLAFITITGTFRGWIIGSFFFWAMEALQIPLLPDQNLFLRGMPAPLAAWGVGWSLKLVFQRTRPFESIVDYVAAGPIPTCRSFPSSHTAAASAFFFALLLVGHPLTVFVGIWFAMVALSRFYLGVNYPTDILAGTIIGFACGLVVSQTLMGF